MKKLNSDELDQLGTLLSRAIEHEQFHIQAEGGKHQASDGLLYPRFFGSSEVGGVSMNIDDDNGSVGVELPAKTLKWMWVRVAGSMGGKTKALNAKKSAKRTSRKSQNATTQAPL